MSGDIINERSENILREFEGVYKGICPSIDSPVGYGELSIIIDSTNLTVRYASGLGIFQGVTDSTKFHEISLGDITDFDSDQNEIRARVLEAEGIHYIFMDHREDNSEEPALLIMGGNGDFRGPTLLFNPQQVAEGLHEQLFQSIENFNNASGQLPRLDNDGRTFRHN